MSAHVFVMQTCLCMCTGAVSLYMLLCVCKCMFVFLISTENDVFFNFFRELKIERLPQKS